MKTFKLAPEIEEKIKALVSELHDTCMKNGVPYVNCVVLSNDDVKAVKAFSCFIKTDDDLADNSLIAGAEMLKMNGSEIPDEVVAGMIAMNRVNNGECDCEECRARRAATAH